MDARRGSRSSQVRPRPPASGRTAPVKTRRVTPSPTRLAGYRRIERRRGLPLGVKALLASGVVALGFAVLWIGSGAVGPILSSAVAGFGGLVSQVGSVVGSPSATEAPDTADAPTIEAPDQPYTNQDVIDITVNVPADIAGSDGFTVRLYRTPAEGEEQLIAEEAVGATSVLLVSDVNLDPGRNDLQASILGPGGESERSEVATWILDQSKPKISVISPKNGAQVKKTSVTFKGKSQAGAEIRLTNSANGAIATATAGKDGLWETVLEVTDGSNAINVTATDLAGNENATDVTVRKGSGKLTASLNASTYRFKASRLPKNIKLSVTVTGPDGSRVKGATALFTISVPGLEAIVSGEITTNSSGVASFTTTIPSGALPGSGLATVLVTTARAGTVTDRQVITITK